ncbi:MAG TPA: hypothetical protein VJV79_16850 [Polyangiaceae bacterium]|nr:hypothetical protein [Polyangiaceae bacterium]
MTRRGRLRLLAAALAFLVLGGLYWLRQGAGFCAWAFASAERAAAHDLNCPSRDVSGGFPMGGCSLLSIRACGKRVTYACHPRRLPLLGLIYRFDCLPAAAQEQPRD